VQVHYDEGVAIYIGPEPCVGVLRPSKKSMCRVNRVDSAMSTLRPLILQERRQSGHGSTSRSCQGTKPLVR
jgi:hypothetical protein